MTKSMVRQEAEPGKPTIINTLFKTEVISSREETQRSEAQDDVRWE